MKKCTFLLLLMFMLCSCANKQDGQSIFVNQLCGDLCWRNIIVGETTTEEFLQIASSHSSVDGGTVTSFVFPEGGVFDGELRYQFLRVFGDEDTAVNVGAKTINQKIVVLIFQGDLGLSFQEVDETLGEPNFVTSNWVNNGINVFFLNSSEGFEITKFYKSHKTKVTPDDEINSIIFFEPDYFDLLLEIDYLSPDHKIYTMHKWSGYGEISDLYWPPD